MPNENDKLWPKQNVILLLILVVMLVSVIVLVVRLGFIYDIILEMSQELVPMIR